jgi:hypothetical protein
MPAEERYAARLDLKPGKIIRGIDEPIRVGSMLWVFTDPHKGHEFAYNRWYERDHYYAGCMIAANGFAGSRWVATRRHKDARFPAEPDMDFGRDDGSYACVYFVLDGEHDSWLDWATPQANWLYSVDRGFQHRTHYNTGTYRYSWRAYRDRDPVPLELALDHRYAGLGAQFVEPSEGHTEAEVDAWFDAELPSWLPGSRVASIASWSYVPLLDTKADFVPVGARDDRRSLQLFFYEDDPLDTWYRQKELGERLAKSGLGRVVWASPFVPTVIGTDRYVDEIW